MTNHSKVESAQADTKAILANLQKGQILLETTSKDFKPMNFAWVGPKSGIAALKRISESGSAFPKYDLSKMERFEPTTKSNAAPITYDPEQTAKAWESENHATFHNIQKSSNDDENAASGLKSANHVNMPTQFAWNRMNADGTSDAQEAASGTFSPPILL